MTPKLILWESRDRWATAWRVVAERVESARRAERATSPRAWRMVEVRTVEEARSELVADSACAVVAIELLDPGVGEVFDFLADVGRVLPPVPVVLLASGATGRHAPLARELGAVHVVEGPRQLAPLVADTLRHFDRAAPRGERSPSQILDSLPWRGARHAS